MEITMSSVVYQKTKRTSRFCILLGIMLAFAGVLKITVDKVNAACGWGVWADITNNDGRKSYASCGIGESDDGSFNAEKITNKSGETILKIGLKGYRGGSIYDIRWGSDNGFSDISKAVIELIGENTITAEEGVGINLGMPVEFSGEGSLKITAMFPIGGGTLCEVRAQYGGDEYGSSDCSMRTDQLSEVQVKQIKAMLGVHTLIIKPTVVAKEVDTLVEDTPATDMDDNELSPDADIENEKKCPDTALTEQTSDSGWTVWDIVAAVYVGISLVALIGLIIQWFIKRKVSASKNTVLQNSENSADIQDNTQGML